MNKITVKRMKPCELPAGKVFLLNYKYKTELGKFVVMYDKKTDQLYVNETIPMEDIRKMLEIAGYEGKYINDDECEAADTMGYIYEKYGFDVTSILVDFYVDRMKEREDKKAEVKAEKIYKIINEYEKDDNMTDIFCDLERTIHHVWKLARKSEKRTGENIVDYGTKYTFLMGYLMGNGVIKVMEIE